MACLACRLTPDKMMTARGERPCAYCQKVEGKSDPFAPPSERNSPKLQDPLPSSASARSGH